MINRIKYEMKQYAYYFVMPEYTFDRACNAAYADMSRHALRIANQSEEQKDNLRNKAKDFLKEELIALPNVKISEDFDSWYSRVCKSLIDIYSCCNEKDGKAAFHYGHAQKWLNMLFKYIYVFEFKDEFKEYFDARPDLVANLHMPLDNKILEYAQKEFGVCRPKCSWSKLSEKDYFEYQNKLKYSVMNNSKPPYGNIDGKIPFYWELMVWSTL